MPAACCSNIGGGRFAINMFSLGRIPHIPAVTGITNFTWEDLLNLARQGFCRDWHVLTRSIVWGNAEHAPALQPATCMQPDSDKIWSAGAKLHVPIWVNPSQKCKHGCKVYLQCFATGKLHQVIGSLLTLDRIQKWKESASLPVDHELWLCTGGLQELGEEWEGSNMLSAIFK